jgi:hypothetical protein
MMVFEIVPEQPNAWANPPKILRRSEVAEAPPASAVPNFRSTPKEAPPKPRRNGREPPTAVAASQLEPSVMPPVCTGDTSWNPRFGPQEYVPEVLVGRASAAARGPAAAEWNYSRNSAGQSQATGYPQSAYRHQDRFQSQSTSHYVPQDVPYYGHPGHNWQNGTYGHNTSVADQRWAQGTFDQGHYQGVPFIPWPAAPRVPNQQMPPGSYAPPHQPVCTGGQFGPYSNEPYYNQTSYYQRPAGAQGQYQGPHSAVYNSAYGYPVDAQPSEYTAGQQNVYGNAQFYHDPRAYRYQ